MFDYGASRSVLIVFARDPIPGQVKTRLIPSLGEEGACALHVKLLQRTLNAAMQCSGIGVELWTDTTAASDRLRRIIANHPLQLRCQQGSNLGQRMQHAIGDALNRSDSVVLIGSDCPDWRAEDLMQAFDELQRNDVVLAPAMDGGYVLVGCRKHAAALFSDIPWGSDQVLAKTRNRLRSLGWRWHELPAHPDIDCEPDLTLVPELLE